MTEAKHTDPIPTTESGHVDPIAAAAQWCREGHAAALATVLQTWGSSPRQPGSQLAVNEAGEFVGSVSGGCVEGAVIQEAREVMTSGLPRTLEFGVSDEDAWAVGLACGGKVSIHVAKVDDPELVHHLLDDREQGRAAVVATRLADGTRWLLHPLDAEGESGSSELLKAARLATIVDRSSVVEVPEGEVFLQVHNPQLRMIVVGAVHITQLLAPMAALAGFAVTVVDPRRAFATELRLPGVQLVQGWPGDELPRLGIDHRTALVTLSHDPKLDDPALEAALESDGFYVGALGSRRTHAKRLERLRSGGLTEAQIERIQAPVGLNIGAVTPGEIAVAVLAQVVEHLRREPDASGTRS